MQTVINMGGCDVSHTGQSDRGIGSRDHRRIMPHHGNIYTGGACNVHFTEAPSQFIIIPKMLVVGFCLPVDGASEGDQYCVGLWTLEYDGS